MHVFMPLCALHTQACTSPPVPQVRYSGALSSFEMNEHLASTERSLPLYPAPARRNPRGATAAASAGLPPVQPLGGKENKEDGTSRDAAADNGDGNLKQQVPKQNVQVEPAGAPTQVAPVSTTPAGGSEAPQQQLQQPPSQDLSVAGSAAPGICAASGVIPGAIVAGDDAIAAIIQKAERLKAAMDEAVLKGLGPALGLGRFGSVVARMAGRGAATPAFAALGMGPSTVSTWSPAKQQREPLQQLGQGRRSNQGEQQQQPWSQLVQVAAALSPRAIRALSVAGARGAANTTATSNTGVAALPVDAAAAGGTAGDAADSDSESGSSGGSYSSGFSGLDEIEEIEDLLLQELLFPSGKQRRARSGGTAAGTTTAAAIAAAAAGAPADATAATAAGLPQLATDAQEAAAGGGAQEAAGGGKPPQRQSGPEGPPLVVTLLGVKGVCCADGSAAHGLAARVRVGGCAAGTAAAEVQLPWQQLPSGSGGTIGTGAAAGGRLVEVQVNGPASLLHDARLATDRPVLAIEVWGLCSSEAGSSGAGAASGSKEVPGAQPVRRGAQGKQLLGIARVPLEAGQPAGGEEAAGRSPLQLDSPCLLASGGFPVWDVLRGRGNGSVQLAVTRLPLPLPALPQPLQEPGSACDEQWVLQGGVQQQGEALPQGLQQQQNVQQEQQLQAKEDVQEEGEEEQELEAGGLTQEEQTAGASPCALLGVLHRFDVTVHSITHLPGPGELQGAGCLAPEFRFVGYTFPGEHCCSAV